ncbi:hypothetical protein ACF1G0_23080 [Streptomyces sp. NPDC013953]|uniref:hypothetical protein n=1 Tax=Streptomyces sp. NPDC013953 TaxID=3364868 RepID=UPI0036F6EFA7
MRSALAAVIGAATVLIALTTGAARTGTPSDGTPPAGGPYTSHVVGPDSAGGAGAGAAPVRNPSPLG